MVVKLATFQVKVYVFDFETKEKTLDKDALPMPSGFIGGIYLGSNVDLGNVLILGVETDAVWADRGETKTVSKILVIDDFNDKFKDAGVTLDENEKFQKGDTAVYRIGFKENGLVQHGFVLVFLSLTALCLM
ncbi:MULTISPECIES: porin [unclassified Bartonella]